MVYVFHATVTFGDVINSSRTICQEELKNLSSLEVVSRLCTALEQHAMSLFNADSEEVPMLEAIIHLFDPEALQVLKSRDGNALITLNSLAWKYLLPTHPSPMRNKDGKRILVEDISNLVPHTLALLRKFVVDEELFSVRTHVGGYTGRTLANFREDVVRAFTKKAKGEVKGLDLNQPHHVRQFIASHGAIGKVTFEEVWGDYGIVARKSARNQKAFERLRSEADVARKIMRLKGHPNIVHFIAVNGGSDFPKEVPSLVLEKLSMTLNDALYHALDAKNGESIYGDTLLWIPLRILLDIARGLEFLHNMVHLIHCDVKDTNIMLDFSGRAKLIDFDTAQAPLSEAERQAGKRLYETASAAVDTELRRRNGDFSFDVDIASFGKVASDLSRWIQSRSELDAMINQCRQRNFLKRPSSSQLVDMILGLIALERAQGEDVPADQFESQQYTDLPISASGMHDLVIDNAVADAFAGTLARGGALTADFIRIGTVNTRNLKLNDKKVQRMSQDHKSRIRALAGLVVKFSFDILALQELCGTADHFSDLQEILTSELQNQAAAGTTWRIILSNLVGTKAERAGYVYKAVKENTEHVRLMSDAVLDGVQEVANWARKPYFAKFRVGASKFLIGTVHLSPTLKNLVDEAKTIPALFDYLEAQKLYGQGSNLIFLGDFNLDAGDGVWSEFRRKGWVHCIPKDEPTNKPDNTQWDNIFVCHEAATLPSRPLQSYKSADSKADLKSDHSILYIDHSFARGDDKSDTTLLPV